MRTSLGVAVVALLMVAGCGSGGSAPAAPSSTSSSAPGNSGQPSTTSGGGDTGSELTLGDQTYDLDVQSCSLAPSGGAVGITAVTSDGNYEFSAGGSPGAVTITLRGVGNPSVWTAAGATPTVGAGTFGYSGTVAGASGDERLTVSINC